jgi:hypothetical protein
MVRGLALLFLVALTVPAAAHAKEPIKITVCGQSGCSEASSPIVGDPFGGSGDGLTSAASPGPYYRLDLDAGGGEVWSIFYVPAARALAIRDDHGWVDWQALAGPGARAVHRLARSVEPFALPTVSAALLNSHPLPGDAVSYLALLNPRGAFDLPDGDSVPFELRSDRPSPWTNVPYLYYPDDDVLLTTPGTFVRLPPGPAAKLEGSLDPQWDGRALASPAERSDGESFPWLWLALGLGGGLLAVGGAILALRRIGAQGRRESLRTVSASLKTGGGAATRSRLDTGK